MGTHLSRALCGAFSSIPHHELRSMSHLLNGTGTRANLVKKPLPLTKAKTKATNATKAPKGTSRGTRVDEGMVTRWRGPEDSESSNEA